LQFVRKKTRRKKIIEAIFDFISAK